MKNCLPQMADSMPSIPCKLLYNYTLANLFQSSYNWKLCNQEKHKNDDQKSGGSISVSLPPTNHGFLFLRVQAVAGAILQCSRVSLKLEGILSLIK